MNEETIQCPTCGHHRAPSAFLPKPFSKQRYAEYVFCIHQRYAKIAEFFCSFASSRCVSYDLG
ncbi:MAG: hypothetical protein AAGJ35_10235, partial [Myxococcota bacterium]